MTGCPGLAGGDVAGIAQALKTIDCRTGETTAYAFGHLFGASGRLLPALTALLTLYVAFFAISLLTGRSRLGIASLTPRMMTLGLVLTFATSWAAYQNVVWTLASGAPDQVASLLAGTQGSATTAFADRLDRVFTAIADAAHQASIPGAPTETGITPAAAVVGGFSASTALWICALLLMLGTAGVLITAKIALAALLAVGPLFVTLALFTGTRGLFEGWLKAVALFAFVPLLAVLIGGGAVGALTPLVQNIALAGGQPAPRDVAILFLGTCVYLALMVMVVKTASTIVAGWRLPGERTYDAGDNASRPIIAPANIPAPTGTSLSGMPAVTGRGSDDRMRQIVSSLSSQGDAGAGSNDAFIGRSRAVSAQIVPIGGETARVANSSGRRIQGVGSRFRLPPATLSKGHVS